MAKRSTIGENPLDAVVQENPLDTVVPNLAVVPKAGRSQPHAEELAEIQERVLVLEAGFENLATQLAAAKATLTEASSQKEAVGVVQEELARLRREVEHLAAEAAAAKTLEAEVSLLKGELAQIREAAGPGDLPWWMRGKKK